VWWSLRFNSCSVINYLQHLATPLWPQENIVLIAKQRARLASLEELHTASACAVPIEEEGEPCQRQQPLTHQQFSIQREPPTIQPPHQQHQHPTAPTANGMDIDNAGASALSGVSGAAVSGAAGQGEQQGGLGMSPPPLGDVQDTTGVWL